MTPFRSVAWSLSVALFAGCSSQHHLVSIGKIATPDVTIQAVDGSFSLKSGEDFSIPFHGSRVVLVEAGLLGQVSAYLGDGARRVKLTVRGKQLHGVIYFAPVPQDAPNVVKRLSEIVLDDRYVNAATGARTAVVHDVFPARESGISSGLFLLAGSKGGQRDYASWVIWLSDYAL